MGERDGDKIVRVINPVENRIRVDASFEPLFSVERFNEIQDQLLDRGKSQRGIRRTKDLGKYPLATRVIDLTESCGSIMYGTTIAAGKAGKGPFTAYYKCGRYMKTKGCKHNKVDAEKLLEITLRTLKHAIRRTGSRSDLVRRLTEIATTRSTVKPEQGHLRTSLETRIATLKRDRLEIGKKLSTESDTELVQIFRSQFTEKGLQIEAIQRDLDSSAQTDDVPSTSPGEQVQKALELLDKLEQLASLPEAREQLYDVLSKLGVWVGVDFHGVKSGKRPVRRVRHGIISIGGYNLPVPLHGCESCDPKDSPSVGGCTIDNLSAASVSVSNPGDGDGRNAGITAKINKKNDSLTMVSRGDRIRTCDLLVPNQSRYQPAPRPVFKTFLQDRLFNPAECIDVI